MMLFGSGRTIIEVDRSPRRNSQVGESPTLELQSSLFWIYWLHETSLVSFVVNRPGGSSQKGMRLALHGL